MHYDQRFSLTKARWSKILLEKYKMIKYLIEDFPCKIQNYQVFPWKIHYDHRFSPWKIQDDQTNSLVKYKIIKDFPCEIQNDQIFSLKVHYDHRFFWKVHHDHRFFFEKEQDDERFSFRNTSWSKIFLGKYKIIKRFPWEILIVQRLSDTACSFWCYMTERYCLE